MNLQETHVLRKLDETCDRENPKIIETNYGDVRISQLQTGNFMAQLIGDKMEVKFYGYTASQAFLNFAEKVTTLFEIAYVRSVVAENSNQALIQEIINHDTVA